jgi:hypothetical protein
MVAATGGLLDGVSALARNGTAVGVLVIDEQSDAAHAQTNAQRMVIAACRGMDFAFWLIELHPKVTSTPHMTSVQLRTLLPPDTPRIRKRSWSGFYGTTLGAELAATNMTHVVILGMQANMCVEATAVGKRTGRNGTGVFQDGAVQQGITVHTSELILRGGPAAWSGHPDVRFYATL